MPQRKSPRSRPRRKYGPKASQQVERSVHKYKRGKLKSGRTGRRVKSREQAIAIGLSEAREKGAKVPARGRKKSSRKRSAASRGRKSSSSRGRKKSARR